MLDLTAQYSALKREIDQAVAEVLTSQQFILGRKVEAFETAIAAYLGVRHAVGVSSGTDALLMCLMDSGIGPGDEVITSAFTFFATAGAISRLGATPVFVDIDSSDYNLNAGTIEKAITRRTKAIIPVHLYGRMISMDEIRQLGEKYNLTVIEDAAQAIGARRHRQMAGTVGEYGCFSFFPSKNLGAAGDAGLVVTNDDDRAKSLRILRSHGAEKRYYHRVVGGNFRMDELQAAVLLAKLPYLDRWTRARQENARRYHDLFQQAGVKTATANEYEDSWKQGSPSIYLPALDGASHVFHQFVIRTGKRDELKSHLERCGVGNEIYYPVPLHLQKCFEHLGYGSGDLPASERAARETLALPIYPELGEEKMSYVVQSIAAFVRQNQSSQLLVN